MCASTPRYFLSQHNQSESKHRSFPNTKKGDTFKPRVLLGCNVKSICNQLFQDVCKFRICQAFHFGKQRFMN